MNVLEPYKIHNIDVNNIVFKKTKLVGNKKIIFLKYKDDKLNNFVIQLSKIKSNNVIDHNEIEFIIDNGDNINFFEKLDDFIIEQSKENYSWFDHLKNTSSMNYERILRDDNSIKLKLCNNDELVTKLFINDDIVTDFNDIISNESTTKIILEIYAIYVKSKSFGLLLRPINILMKFKEKPIYDYKFLEDTENNSNISELDELNLQSEINNDNYDFDNNCDNKLFIKTHNIFADNSSTTSCDFDLEKCIT